MATYNTSAKKKPNAREASMLEMMNSTSCDIKLSKQNKIKAKHDIDGIIMKYER